jgi:hypothetical protein
LETTCNQLAIFPRLFTIKSWDAIALSMGESHPHSIGKPPAFSQETHGISWGRAIFSNQTISIHISDHFCQKPSGFIEQSLHPRGILAPQT